MAPIALQSFLLSIEYFARSFRRFVFLDVSATNATRERPRPGSIPGLWPIALHGDGNRLLHSLANLDSPLFDIADYAIASIAVGTIRVAIVTKLKVTTPDQAF